MILYEPGIEGKDMEARCSRLSAFVVDSHRKVMTSTVHARAIHRDFNKGSQVSIYTGIFYMNNILDVAGEWRI